VGSLQDTKRKRNASVGLSIAQAVSRWLPTAAARVRSRVWSSGICGGQSGAGKVFSEYFGFPCQSSFHQLLHNHPHLSSGAGTIGPKWPQYKGFSPTPIAIKKTLPFMMIFKKRLKNDIMNVVYYMWNFIQIAEILHSKTSLLLVYVTER
jgi:hypothetical protein